MKHKTLRTLLCVILTVCFCLSAIAPVSAAGLFSGDTGAASIFDEWIRSLKDRFIEKNPGTDETPAENETAAGNDFIRIFHLDCGRRYFSVKEINGIIDELAANHYTHIELGFGNDGFRFLLDETDANGNPITITANDTTYNLSDVNTAIHSGNVTYSNGCSYTPDTHELTQSDMDEIISHANDKGIGIIPLMDIPGHSNALIDAMNHSSINLNVTSHTTGKNIYNVAMRAFEITDAKAVSFVMALAEKYIDYFASKGCKYFNLGADECGYTLHNNYIYGQDEYLALANMLNTIGNYIVGKSMTPMIFNDGFRKTNGTDYLKTNLSEKFVVCYWTESGYTIAAELATKFKVVNTHNGWYYVIGNNNSSWAGYNTAMGNFKTIKCTSCDSGYTTNYGCMFAVWCDDPSNKPDYESRIYPLIRELASNNTDYFKAPVTPVAPTITVSANSLTVDGTATLSTSDGSLATWASSDEKVLVLEVVATKDVVVATKDVTAASVTVRAVGAGTATVTAKLSDGTTLTSETITVRNQGEVTDEERTVSVTVGQTLTLTETISGQHDVTQENEFAKVVAESREVAGETTYTKKGLPIAGESAKYYISSSKNDSSPAIEITIEKDTDENYYLKNANGHYIYPTYNDNKGYTVATSNTKKSVNISGDVNSGFIISCGFTYGYYNYTYQAYLNISNDTLRSNYNSQNLYLYEGKTTPAGYETVVTVTGKKVTTAPVEMIVGTVKYLITVTAENLSGVTPLPIQLWITNNTIEGSGTNAKTTGSGWGGDNSLGTARYISVPATTANATSSVYSEAGMLVVDAFTAAGMTEPLKRYEWGGTRFITAKDDKAAQDLVFWTGRIHNSTDSNIQNVWGADYSNSGSAFNYVRYYGGEWAVSADGKTGWTTVTGAGSTGHYYNCTQQLAAYYMTRTAITEEVTTDVADWGKPKDGGEYDSQVSSDFVLLDFAVKYEDGTQRPGKDDFPVSGKTLAYHCETDNAAVGTQNGVKYRMLNNFRAVNTTEYEVYKVTVTMTSGSASTQLTAYAAKNGYTYDSTTEQIVWAIDEAARDASGLEEYTSISGSTTYSGCKIGGTPDVRGVEVYNKHGALITYYVRAKANPDSLTVNYFVEDATDPFYHYNINVDTSKPESTFKEGIALNAANWKGKLDNGDVVNIKGQRQWVSADLGSMPEIGAQYRFSNYMCVRVDRVSEKIVNLYYTFEAKASFVVDFGLPIIITPADLNADLATSANITGAIVSDTSYATVKTDGKNIIYTLKKPLDSVDTFTIQYVGKNLTTEKEGDATYDIKIIPANNVYYEENFLNVAENTVWEDTGTANNPNQALEKADEVAPNVYGYDPAYDDQPTEAFSMGNAKKATLNLTAADFSVKTADALTFTFKGDGYDLISACGSDTGNLYVKTYKVNADGTETLRYVTIMDTYFSGDTTGVIKYGTTDYQVPVIRKMDLRDGYGTYKVEVYGFLRQSSGVMNPTVPAQTASYASIDSPVVMDYEPNTNVVVDEILAAFGDTDLTDVEVELSFVDTNSVLNGGTGVFTSKVSKEVMTDMRSVAEVQANASDYKAGSAVVYVDAFRVYNPIDISKAIEEGASDAVKNTAAAYEKHGEKDVKYYSLYDFVMTSINDLGEYADNTAIYVEYDGDTGKYTIADYKVQGPENEIYLTRGNAIAFALTGYNDGDVVQYSARAVTDGANPGGAAICSTEMYYKAEVLQNYDFNNVTKVDYVIIQNEGSGVLAVSGLKVSKDIEPYASAELAKKVEEKLNPSDTATFVPATLKVTAPQKVRANRAFSIRIDASAYLSNGTHDVAKVTIVEPGSLVETELTATNTKAVASGRTMNYRYSQAFKLSAGTYTYTVYAYNEAGVKSDPVTVTIVVE